MKKKEVKQRMKGQIIAVLREKNIDLAKEMIKTLIQNSVTTIEITFSIPNAERLIHEIKHTYPSALIGAGTVLTKEQAELARENGADFIVSPCVIEEIGQYCKEHDLFCSLGAMTPTEVYQSYLAGSDVVKLFPGESIQMNMIKAIKAPMPFIDMMPTGGVNNTNIKQWFENGAFAVGVGGFLTKEINFENLDLLESRCQSLISALKQ